ncbi:JAB domain-containing protein [Coraliomargarita parva]|uniref:JAB domain-containing protein n=1 Tax=Coraliomargarita parva TaxID=3014050 RepID=UPI0022B5C85E|nr:JAB domain-containing protein [Coraliomargarita parva]
MRVHEASLQFRVVREGKVEPLDTPQKVADYVRDAFDGDPTCEWFLCIPLNRRNMPFGRVLISKGTASSCLVSPREVLRPCILSNATGMVVAHNHPSGDTSPSRADLQITRQLKDAAQAMGVDFLDHIIVGDPDSEIYSFNEAGLV